MNQNYPIYTVKNECHDCYKCVRHCPAKAIRVIDGSASVIPELCVACGRCVQICPAGAKRIRDDLSRAKYLLRNNERVIASIAPSWMNYFNTTAGALIAVLKNLGFYGVSETALGAQQASLLTGRLLETAGPGIHISSACPAAVEYIQKYLPDLTGNITPLLSPLLTHCEMLRKKYGNDIGVIFFGPCAAKKHEADRHPGRLDLALTFDDLDNWLKQEELTFDENAGAADFIPEPAEEGRLYPIEGGMLDTVKDDSREDTVYLTLSGLPEIDMALSGVAETGDKKVFIECLACRGGCINGPVMCHTGDTLKGLITIAEQRTRLKRNSLWREPEVTTMEKIVAQGVRHEPASEDALRSALLRIGKYDKNDELNCGGCGYQTCRGFAAAMLEGKAEAAMCVSYMRKMAQKKANALIKYIPAGVVIVDSELRLIECNKYFSGLFDESNVLAYSAMPGMKGVDLAKTVPFPELFEAVLASGKDLTRENYVVGDHIFDVKIFTIENHRVVGGIIQDVTRTEMHREQIAEKARQVIRKNILTVQKVANCLGEHMAETEILLREVARGYEHRRMEAGDKDEK